MESQTDTSAHVLSGHSFYYRSLMVGALTILLKPSPPSLPQLPTIFHLLTQEKRDKFSNLNYRKQFNRFLSSSNRISIIFPFFHLK